jgi:hypothetical protein
MRAAEAQAIATAREMRAERRAGVATIWVPDVADELHLGGHVRVVLGEHHLGLEHARFTAPWSIGSAVRELVGRCWPAHSTKSRGHAQHATNERIGSIPQRKRPYRRDTLFTRCPRCKPLTRVCPEAQRS